MLAKCGAGVEAGGGVGCFCVLHIGDLLPLKRIRVMRIHYKIQCWPGGELQCSGLGGAGMRQYAPGRLLLIVSQTVSGFTPEGGCRAKWRHGGCGGG
ncbi:hypothetical protein GCM10011348_19460 [Marinobacterium nitratireducens]|uniref:Uncharacterized protein n=1 Tax=Marinobacterium nitratireducens TaxID=518897 RepID=A0A917ZEN2_9GAMM|nr:hypothetical protein GCM10011348_19460 [Marinobacterium nitratireducens]